MRKRFLAMSLACMMLFTCIMTALPVAADATYAYEIIQDFSNSANYTRNSMWSRGVLTAAKCPLTGATDGAATIFQMDGSQVNAGENMLNGTSALSLRMNSAGYGWGASHLMNGDLPQV